MRLMLDSGDRRHVVDVRVDGQALLLEREGTPPLGVEVIARDASTLLLRLDGRLVRARYARRGHDLYLHIAGDGCRFHLVDEQEQEELAQSAGSPIVRAPMPGKVIAVLVKVGDTVGKGQPVVRLEAMKMEVDVPATLAGVVASLAVQPGEQVGPDAALLTLTPAAG